MALVWTAADGEEGSQVWVQASALGSVRMVLLEIVPGTALPDGTVEGQPLLWSPAGENQWLPGLDMRCNTVSAEDDALLALVGGTNGAQLSAQGTGSVQMLGSGGSSVTLAIDAVNMSASATQRLSLVSDATPVFDVNDDGTRPNTIAFLGKLPTVGRQSVTGDTQQAQIDSIVEALTEFGLTADDRPAIPGPFITQISNSALPSQTIEAIPASAPSGYYAVTLIVNCRVGASGGTYTVTANYTTSGGIASSLSLGNVNTATPGAVTGSATRTYDFGTGTPFNLVAVAAAITGSPDFDISSVATYVGPIPP